MFTNNFRGGDRGGFGGGDRGADRPLFDATCTECGDQCQVPFRPSPGKSVKCRNCFKKDDAGSGFERPSFRARDRGSRGEGRNDFRGATPPDTGKLLAQLARIEEKLDIMIEALMGDAEEVEVDESDEDDEDMEEGADDSDEKGDDKDK